jgi:hypothetical protein
MSGGKRSFLTIEAREPTRDHIRTTLYELVGAISDELRVGEDRLIAETLFHLADTGRVGRMVTDRTTAPRGIQRSPGF